MHRDNFHFANCKQKVTQYVVPDSDTYQNKETKPVVEQVQGYVISSIIFCDMEMTLPYCFFQIPQSRTYKPAERKGAVIVTNVTRESGIWVCCCFVHVLTKTGFQMPFMIIFYSNVQK